MVSTGGPQGASRLMLYRIKPFLNRWTALAALVVVVFAGLAYLYESASGSREEASGLDYLRLAAVIKLETQKWETAAASRDLTGKRQELEQKKEQLEVDRQLASIANLTTAQDAEGLGSRIINYAVDNRLEIVDFQNAKTVTVITPEETLTFIDGSAPNVRRITETCDRLKNDDPSEGWHLPTVTYTFKTRGGKDAQIGLIGLAGDAGTARVETLDMVREDDLADEWSLKVCLHVPYAEM